MPSRRSEQMKGDALLAELLRDPEGFHAAGRTYALLQEFLDGFPLKEIEPLLSSANVNVRRAGIWLASEMGRKADPLAAQAAKLFADEDPYIRYYVLDLLVLFPDHAAPGAIEALRKDPDPGVQARAIELFGTGSTGG